LYPALHFDPKVAKNILTDFTAQGSFYVYNYDEPFMGGYPRLSRSKGNYYEEAGLKDDRFEDTARSNWDGFVEKIKQAYWRKEGKEERYRVLSDFAAFEDRKPKSPRELLLSTPQEMEIDGKKFTVKYSFFNVKEVLKYYNRLVLEFFPDFVLQEKVSDKKHSRYAKKIGDSLLLGLYIDYSYLEKELQMTYLEFPTINVELFSSSLSKSLKEEAYLGDQEEYPIVRIDPGYFMGNMYDYRIGNSSQNENLLKRNLFFYFEVYSFYLRVYLKHIEHNIAVVFKQLQ
jgi:hypothetical protein